MGELNEFPIGMRLFLKTYPWRRIDPVPWTPLRRPLAESGLALVSSAGFVLRGQEPFDETRRGGDPSIREIPAERGQKGEEPGIAQQGMPHCKSPRGVAI
jgi:D-proline reductase (dithiol) PrdB